MSNKIEKQIYFGSKDELCHMSIGEVMSQYSEKNKNDYEPVSVGKLGIRLRSEVFGRQLNTDNKKNKVIYKNTLTIGMGSKTIDYSVLHQEKYYSVSPDYKTFNISHNIDSYYWDMYFKVIADKLFYLYAKENTRNGRRIDIDSLLKHKVTIPANNSYIGKYLSSIDNLINSKNMLIHQLQMQKQSFIQSQMKYEKWDGHTSFKLSQIISERNETSVKGQLEHVSLTKRGVVPKTDRYNRDALVTDDTIKKYKVTRLHDLVYNPANLKFGVIALNTYKDGIFSPIYVTYSINSNVNKLYLSTYCSTKSFLQYIRKYEEGTVYERMAVKSSDFLKATVFLPSLEIQSIFSNTLSQMDKLIEIEEKKLEQLEKMKKYHLQQFFN